MDDINQSAARLGITLSEDDEIRPYEENIIRELDRLMKEKNVKSVD